jgi:hypothetical protein
LARSRPHNQQEVAAAQYLFENLFFGMDLPDKWVDPMPDASGFTWDVAGAPVRENGHCVVGVGYGAKGVTIDTWGLLGTLTWKAIALYCSHASDGGLYTMLSPDEIRKGRIKAPNGVDWDMLIADFNAIGGKVKPPGPKPPGPGTGGVQERPELQERPEGEDLLEPEEPWDWPNLSGQRWRVIRCRR